MLDLLERHPYRHFPVVENDELKGMATRIEIASAAGKQSGLLSDWVVSCVNLATIHETRIDRAIGSLPAGEKIGDVTRRGVSSITTSRGSGSGTSLDSTR